MSHKCRYLKIRARFARPIPGCASVCRLQRSNGSGVRAGRLASLAEQLVEARLSFRAGIAGQGGRMLHDQHIGQQAAPGDGIAVGIHQVLAPDGEPRPSAVQDALLAMQTDEAQRHPGRPTATGAPEPGRLEGHAAPGRKLAVRGELEQGMSENSA